MQVFPSAGPDCEINGKTLYQLLLFFYISLKIIRFTEETTVETFLLDAPSRFLMLSHNPHLSWRTQVNSWNCRKFVAEPAPHLCPTSYPLPQNKNDHRTLKGRLKIPQTSICYQYFHLHFTEARAVRGLGETTGSKR